MPKRIVDAVVDRHPALVHRISERLLTCRRPTGHLRVAPRREAVNRMRAVDVWFQIDVHCVSVRAVKWYTKAAIMLSSMVFCAVLILLIVLFWEENVPLPPPAEVYIALVTGSALGVIVAIKLIK